MLERENILEIENLEVDTFSSIMLNDFKEQLDKYDGIQFIAENKAQREGEKCTLTLAVNFALSVAAGVVSGLLIELCKSVYSRHAHPKGYRWKFKIKMDKGYSKAIVYKDLGVVVVDIQKIESEKLPEG